MSIWPPSHPISAGQVVVTPTVPLRPSKYWIEEGGSAKLVTWKMVAGGPAAATTLPQSTKPSPASAAIGLWNARALIATLPSSQRRWH